MPVIPPKLVDSLSDRYRLEGELGQGGMATVYLAQDIKHDRRVAIKVLRPELGAVIGSRSELLDLAKNRRARPVGRLVGRHRREVLRGQPGQPVDDL